MSKKTVPKNSFLQNMFVHPLEAEGSGVELLVKLKNITPTLTLCHILKWKGIEDF